MEDLVGKVARCSKGRLGVITGHRKLLWGRSWIGVGLDGQGFWTSRNPTIESESIVQYAESLIPSRVLAAGE